MTTRSAGCEQLGARPHGVHSLQPHVGRQQLSQLLHLHQERSQVEKYLVLLNNLSVLFEDSKRPLSL